MRGSHYLSRKGGIDEIQLPAVWAKCKTSPRETGPNNDPKAAAELLSITNYEVIVHWSEADQLFIPKNPGIRGVLAAPLNAATSRTPFRAFQADVHAEGRDPVPPSFAPPSAK
jgi:hypothetical protein